MNPEPQSTAPPLLIGVPVYNGAGGLARGLESLLTQSRGDFDLLISDNGSTDETPRIAAAFAERPAARGGPAVSLFHVGCP
jgi:glycosyltransferase involved in cell wall biosynthesis